MPQFTEQQQYIANFKNPGLIMHQNASQEQLTQIQQLTSQMINEMRKMNEENRVAMNSMETRLQAQFKQEVTQQFQNISKQINAIRQEMTKKNQDLIKNVDQKIANQEQNVARLAQKQEDQDRKIQSLEQKNQPSGFGIFNIIKKKVGMLFRPYIFQSAQFQQLITASRSNSLSQQLLHAQDFQRCQDTCSGTDMCGGEGKKKQ